MQPTAAPRWRSTTPVSRLRSAWEASAARRSSSISAFTARCWVRWSAAWHPPRSPWRRFAALKTTDFDYDLPPELIAQHPPAQRDAARMLMVDPQADSLTHATVRDLPRYLEPGDLLVLNDTRVLPARLLGRREDGGEAEVLLLRPLSESRHHWEALIRPARRLRNGARIQFLGSALSVVIEDRLEQTATIRLNGATDPMAEVRRVGEMPTPPYIKEHLDDPERYQTVFAREEGSAAAPTAGLHFTPELLA